MDEFIYFMVHPGFHRIPDRRAILRLGHTLLCSETELNLFYPMLPPYCKTLLPAMMDKVAGAPRCKEMQLNDIFVHAVMLAWERCNQYPVSFRCAEAARLMRVAHEAVEGWDITGVQEATGMRIPACMRVYSAKRAKIGKIRRAEV